MMSMSGYGGSTVDCGEGVFHVSILSYNHRFREINVRVPPGAEILEWEITKLIERKIQRGKVYLTVRTLGTRGTEKPEIDFALVGTYLEAFKEITRKFGVESNLRADSLMSLPGVLKERGNEFYLQKLPKSLKRGMGKALSSLLGVRESEGKDILSAVKSGLKSIEREIKVVAKRAGVVTRSHRSRLREIFREAGCGLSEPGLKGKILELVQGIDITEEITRFSSLLSEFKKTAHLKGPVGRKLDYLLQEMTREINTVGAKGKDVKISCSVVEIKDELQSLRELIQNVE